MNQIEIGFSTLARRLLRRASFASLDELMERIRRRIDYFNETLAKPFRWTFTGIPLRSYQSTLPSPCTRVGKHRPITPALD
jgi:hypothetical protein